MVDTAASHASPTRQRRRARRIPAQHLSTRRWKRFGHPADADTVHDAEAVNKIGRDVLLRVRVLIQSGLRKRRPLFLSKILDTVLKWAYSANR